MKLLKKKQKKIAATYLTKEEYEKLLEVAYEHRISIAQAIKIALKLSYEIGE